MQELRQRFTTVARNMGVVSLLMGNFPVLTLPSLLLLGHAFLPDAAAIDADPTSEQEGSSIAVDPKLECTPYIYPAVANQMSAFPPIGSRASILPNDSTALDKWNSISGSIPTGIGIKVGRTAVKANLLVKIRPQTQPPGDNYPPTDPDCWWTYRQCTNPKVEGIPPDLEAAPEASLRIHSF
ncbi:hypothetical protein D9757_002063 [Collybiopsis confluens]|uniref:Uncharacterized protein n=1 Tax=Collybiopsis confluens TaxID=2823264 RepID=A0A8H5MF15_9AGAR|nr:hypothetical protein D9757_002063 [Collybiopsis confluens]